MALYLVQHGKSLPKDQDPEKGLSETGVAESRRIADVAKGYRVAVSAIYHSGKTRALQTADIFDEALFPPDGINQLDGLDPVDDVVVFANNIDNEKNVMYVGHLPFMERLTSYLITNRQEPLVFKFQNSGIVCLDKDPDTGAWFIKWTLMPRIG